MTGAARVVPDVASFSVDDGFWYSIPDHLASDLSVGSIVRVPLSGRRVRGWVVEISADRTGKLKDIAGISGEMPVFDVALSRTLIWAARHYVAPVSVMLGRATPPNLPRYRVPTPSPVEPSQPTSALAGVVTRTATGRTVPITALVGSWHRTTWIESIAPVLASSRSVAIVTAAAAEARSLLAAAKPVYGDLVIGVTGDDAASDTESWELAQSAPRLIVGTPKLASWQIADLGLAIVLEEGRRAMKDRQTPTLHVRDVMSTRSRVEGFNLVFFGPTPGAETLAAGADVIKEGNRAWGLVEVVDRSEEAPGSGFLSSRTVAALAATAETGRRSFVFAHRRGGLASTRCARCRTLRSCVNCGSRLPRVDRCPRCRAAAGACSNCGGTEFEELGTVPERLVTELNRRISPSSAQVHPGDSLITVGTERDLADIDELVLAVASDVDGMLLGTGYRTAEEALRQLARLGSLVGGRASRLMLQTSRPDSLLVTTMRRGDPIPYLERVLVDRAREGLPPATQMIAVEVRGDIPENVGAALEALPGNALVMGPAPVDTGQRWLLSGELGETRLGLRPLVGVWRDRGATVRVDADPIDL